MHAVDIGPFHEIRSPAVTSKQVFQFLVRNSCRDGGIVDLVSIQMKNGQNRSIACRVQIFVDVPRRRKRSGLGFSIAHDRRHNQFGIVKRRATCMRENVAEFTPFVNGSGSLRRAVAADSAGKRKLLEELVQSLRIQALFWINFRVRAFEIRRAEYAGGAVARAGEKDHVQIVFLDQPI